MYTIISFINIIGPTKFFVPLYHRVCNAFGTICGQVSSGGHQHHSSSASSGHSHSPGCGIEQLSKTNLYIRGLEPETSDIDLYNMCERLLAKFDSVSHCFYLHFLSVIFAFSASVLWIYER